MGREIKSYDDYREVAEGKQRVKDCLKRNAEEFSFLFSIMLIVLVIAIIVGAIVTGSMTKGIWLVTLFFASASALLVGIYVLAMLIMYMQRFLENIFKQL